MDDQRPKLYPFNFPLFCACVIFISIITSISIFCSIGSIIYVTSDTVPESEEAGPIYESLTNEEATTIGAKFSMACSLSLLVPLSLISLVLVKSNESKISWRTYLFLGIITVIELAVSRLITRSFLSTHGEAIQNDQTVYYNYFDRMLGSGLIPLGVGILIALWQYINQSAKLTPSIED